MKYLCDSSAVFRAIKENKIDLLAGNYTLELARYELGNIIWKDYFLQAKVSKEESEMIAKTVKHALAIMEILQIACNEEEILKTATQLKITFYDASYAFFAKAEELRLITEDSRLMKKLTPVINVSMLNDIEPQNWEKPT
jgi:predicted nucleic acid-binding protein